MYVTVVGWMHSCCEIRRGRRGPRLYIRTRTYTLWQSCVRSGAVCLVRCEWRPFINLVLLNMYCTVYCTYSRVQYNACPESWPPTNVSEQFTPLLKHLHSCTLQRRISLTDTSQGHRTTERSSCILEHSRSRSPTSLLRCCAATNPEESFHGLLCHYTFASISSSRSEPSRVCFNHSRPPASPS